MTGVVDRAQLRALAQQAASGNVAWWTFEELDDGTMLATDEAAFIAAAHPGAVLALLDALEKAEQALEQSDIVIEAAKAARETGYSSILRLKALNAALAGVSR